MEKYEKRYKISIRTHIGTLEIDDIYAYSEREAIDQAYKSAHNEIDVAKVDEVLEYKN